MSEVSQGSYKLKPQFYGNLDVDQWPFYTESQKQMLKRSILNRSFASEANTTSAAAAAASAEDSTSLPIKVA